MVNAWGLGLVLLQIRCLLYFVAHATHQERIWLSVTADLKYLNNVNIKNKEFCTRSYLTFLQQSTVGAKRQSGVFMLP